MSPRPRKRGGANSGRSSSTIDQRVADLWRPPAPLPEVRPITPSTDASLVLRSLGDPPLGPKSVLAGHYLAALIDRSAGVAMALAASADLIERAEE